MKLVYINNSPVYTKKIAARFNQIKIASCNSINRLDLENIFRFRQHFRSD